MGVIRDLMLGLQKKANLDDETLHNVRIYESHGGKVYRELPEDFPVATISEFTALYAEVVPEEEQNAEDGDGAIYCFHFDKEPNKPHGIPFKFLVKPVSQDGRYVFGRQSTDQKQGELFKDTKIRLSTRIGLKGKQFDKIKFAIVQRSIYSKPTYLNDGKCGTLIPCLKWPRLIVGAR